MARGAQLSSNYDPRVHRKSILDAPSLLQYVQHHQNDQHQMMSKRAAGGEHVVVNVAGMTCTSCVKKISDVMSSIQGLSNATGTFVSETAEFDVDHNTSAKSVIARIDKDTGFKLSRVSVDHQSIDVIMSPGAAKRYRDNLPRGVLEMEHHKGHCRITYDPNLIGAQATLTSDMRLGPPANNTATNQSQRRLNRMLFSFTASAILTMPVLVLNCSQAQVAESTKDIVSCVLATLVQAIAIPNFYVGAIKSLVHSRVIEMDMLVVISITAAYFYSLVAFALVEAGYNLETKAFFETSTLLITLILLGRALTAVARVKAMAAVSIRSLQPQKAVLVHNGDATEIDARLLQLGDTIRVASHARVVTDGLVLLGETTVDESMITGESRPIMKKSGDSVIAGTINGGGIINVQLTRLRGQNSITDIARIVQDAMKTKPKVQEIADKLAELFVPVVVATGIIVFCIWLVIAIAIRKLNGGAAVGLSITYAIAVFAVSCPCALGLAVPMVLVIAGAVSVREGVVVRTSIPVERGLQTTYAVFDKTETLTKAELTVVREEVFESCITYDQSLSLVRAMVGGNKHPVSQAILSHLKGESNLTLDSLQSVPGDGIQACWCGSLIRVGNPHWVGVDQQPQIAEMLSSMTMFCFTIDGKLALAFGLQSVLRSEAQPVIKELQRRGITCHVVSGDTAKVVECISTRVGISPSEVKSRCTPSQKQKYVQDVQAGGKKVIFIGDGTNDAAAVAQADIGLQIGRASDVTDKVADVILLGGLDGIVGMLNISRRAWWCICFNFAWSAIYNIFAILLAAGVFVTIRLPPAYAGLGEIVSVMPVILAAASLALYRKRSSFSNNEVAIVSS